MAQHLYLTALLLSFAGVLALDYRYGTRLAGRRLLRAILVTVPVFLLFDVVGSGRGWFHSNPSLNTAIVSPGIPIEEPILLAFLTLVSVALWRAGKGVAR